MRSADLLSRGVIQGKCTKAVWFQSVKRQIRRLRKLGYTEKAIKKKIGLEDIQEQANHTMNKAVQPVTGEMDGVPYIYDPQKDELFIHLDSTEARARSDQIDPKRYVTYAGDGRPIGIELLDVKNGSKLDSLPEQKIVKRILSQLGLPFH